MKRATISTAFLALLGLAAGAWAEDPYGYGPWVQIKYTKQYGFEAIGPCRVSIQLHNIPGDWIFGADGRTILLRCSYGLQDVRLASTLSNDEANELFGLVECSEPFGGKADGIDETDHDGAFHTLEIHVGEKAVVLVTTGNPSFEGDSCRARLERKMKALFSEIWELRRPVCWPDEEF